MSKHKLGSDKRPIIARVHTDEQARYVAETCQAHGWHFIVGFEPDKPVDMSDLEQMLNPPVPITSTKVGRNDPCPCGSGKKARKFAGSAAKLGDAALVGGLAYKAWQSYQQGQQAAPACTPGRAASGRQRLPARTG